MLKVIIAGGRDFEDREKLDKEVIQYLRDLGATQKNTEIVCGMANGADMLGRTWAAYKRLPVKEMPADWDRHGKSAGYIRNEQMAKYADALIAFWDTKSAGTNHMINLAIKHGLSIRIVLYTPVPKDKPKKLTQISKGISDGIN